MSKSVLWFQELSMHDVPKVGGKNASLGEMISNLYNAGINVPNGFATTAEVFQQFIQFQGLDKTINQILDTLDIDNISALTEAGAKIRGLIENHPLPEHLENDIREAYNALSEGNDISVAVRSSATAEDLPEASFAGQQETFLNVVGFTQVIECVRKVFASLFNDRAISYRVHHGFAHADVSLSAGIQKMVRSDRAASGVMFTIDTESGFDKAIFITSSWGLGECVVQGSVNPDEFYLYKPNIRDNRPALLRKTLGSKRIKMVFADAGDDALVKTIDVPTEQQQTFSISDDEAQHLAKMAMTIEHHYQRPMDIEWGKDGETGEIFILQARPETVKSRDEKNILQRYILKQKSQIITTGRSVGQRIGSGKARIVNDISQLDKVQPGDVLVTDMTDPDWEPVMKRASAIITNRGGRTCHAAIIARELGVPAIVGCGDATDKITEQQAITVSCAEGDTGFIYEGELEFELITTSLDEMPPIPFKIYMNIGNPERAFDLSQTPNHGVGLARLEFIINNTVGVHPKALLNKDNMPENIRNVIEERIAGYADGETFFVQKLVEGIASLGAAFYPKPVIVRLSDFKSNEYANMVGGENFEPHEENPMLGFRGTSRYLSESFRQCFELECRALKYARDEMGLDNIQIMVPFVRTLSEADQIIDLLGQNGLKRGENGLKVIMMCEIPSNAILADEFLERFDGFSIGSNDLTQFTLGLDRDSEIIAHLFDERDEAVKAMIERAITACKKANKYIGICGQGPSDHPDFANWLVHQGIDSVSLNPDTVIETWLYLANS